MLEGGLLSALKPGIIHVWLVDIGGQVQLVPTWVNLLSTEEIERSNGYRFEQDRFRFFIRRSILRLLISRYTGASPAEIVYFTNPYGKLSLPLHPLHFSISHSQGRIAYAFSKQQDLGVDIEQVKPLPRLDQLAKSWFSLEESAGLHSLNESERLEGFYHVWTQKEAFIKAHGEGLTFPIREFSVSVDPHTSGGLLSITNDVALSWKMISFKPDPGWRVAVCVRSETIPEVKQYNLTLQDFYAQLTNSI